MNTVMCRTIFSLALLTLVACGGGSGGGTSSTSSPVLVTVPDNQSPVTTPPPVATPPPPILGVTVAVDNTTPPARTIPRTTTDYFDNLVVTAKNPNDTDKQATIFRSCGEGTLLPWIQEVAVFDGTAMVGYSGLANGCASFAGASVMIPAHGEKKLTVKLKFDPSMPALGAEEIYRSVKFGFAVGDIVLGDKAVPFTGLPLVGNPAYVEKGKIIYGDNDGTLDTVGGIHTQDIETGAVTAIWSKIGLYTTGEFTRTRTGRKVAFTGGFWNKSYGVHVYSFENPPASISDDLPMPIRLSNSYWWGNSCGMSPWGPFDLTATGDIAVFSAICYVNGEQDQSDITLMKMDGTMFWSRVTDSPANDFSPVIVSAVNDIYTVYYASDRSLTDNTVDPTKTIRIWKQVRDAANDIMVGPPMVIVDTGVTNIKSWWINRKMLSMSPDYQSFVFVKNVNGRPHIIKASLDGQTTLDLGEGEVPNWADDTRITFSILPALYSEKAMLVNVDGTERREITSFSPLHEMTLDINQIVFMP